MLVRVERSANVVAFIKETCVTQRCCSRPMQTMLFANILTSPPKRERERECGRFRDWIANVDEYPQFARPVLFPRRLERIAPEKVENEERDASADTRLVEPRSSPIDRTNTVRIFARVGSHDGVEKDAAPVFSSLFPFTLLEPRQMQLWVNGSLKVPLRLHEGLQSRPAAPEGSAWPRVYQIT